MVTKVLNEIMGDRVKVEILRFLIQNPGEYTGRQVWRNIGGCSHTKAINSLKELEVTGQLKRRSAAPSYLFSINESNRFVGQLRALFDTEARILDEVGAVFKEKLGEALVRMLVFGSVAGGEDRPGSDMDLILSIKDGSKMSALEAKVEEAIDASEEFTGSHIDYVLIENRELKRKQFENKQAMWADVFGDKPVILLEFKRGNKPVRRFIPQGKLLNI